jgi:uncharacterized repeat protein (TIGR01451 family)
VGTAVTNAQGIATISYKITQSNGIYSILALFIGDETYAGNSNTNNLTVYLTPTYITVKNVKGLNKQKVTLKATIKDANRNPLNGQTLIFHINGHNYNSVTSNNGIATITYIPYGAGIYNITVNYMGNNQYTDSQSTGLLTVKPSSYLYIKIKSSNNNPKIGEPFTITYKIGNKGPDNATNVKMSIPLPSGFNISNITGDGNWTYNTADNIITWTLTNVTIGDPYLYIIGKTSNSGVYVFGSNITSETNNLNTEGVTPITITATNPITPTNPTTPTTKTTLNAATTTIPMQHTGIPFAGLIFGVLSVLGGSIMTRKK